MKIESILNLITIISAVIILIAFIFAWSYVVRITKNNQLLEKKRWIEQLPSVISTLGVLGTFLGITIGLVFFDTSDLDASIPLLLSGLKTAFFTSLAGIIGSLVLSRIVNKVLDDSDKGVSDINHAASIISQAVKDMSTANVNTMNALLQQSKEQALMLSAIREDGIELMEVIKKSSNTQLVDILDEVKTNIQSQGQVIDSTLSNIKDCMNKQLESLVDTISATEKDVANVAFLTQSSNLQLEYVNSKLNSISTDVSSLQNINESINGIKEDVRTIAQDSANINVINENMAIALEALGNLDASEQHVSEEIEKLSGAMQTKISEISSLLKAQFAELSEYINKINTQIAKDILTATNSLNDTVIPIRDAVNLISHDSANISTINENVATALEALGNLDASEQHVSEEIEKLGTRMTSDISSIVIKMTDTDKMLTTKFADFTTLLERNDIQALTEYMKSFAVDFQSQMNMLINKLVQDNFTELNKSVKALNNWQQENKSMVEGLIRQYQNMEESFEETSETLSNVERKTQQLVADDGKLGNIVESLNQLLLEDKNFIKVTEALREAAEISRNNSDSLNKTSNNLNQWISTQKKFVSGINVLIEKLDEISKFRDYNHEFWKDVKVKLKEGIDVLNQGTKELNNEVKGIDKHFYTRLSTTLANLDACIQAMYNAAKKG